MATTLPTVMDAVKALVAAVTPTVNPSAASASSAAFVHTENHLPWFLEEKGADLATFDRAFALLCGNMEEGAFYGQMTDRDSVAELTLLLMYQPSLDSSSYNLEKRMASDCELIASKLLKNPPTGCRLVSLTSRIPNRAPTANPEKVTVEFAFKYQYRVNF
jgi:hypothetical protein